MSAKLVKDRRVFEIMLVVLTVGMTFLLYKLGGYKMVALNLYFLPIVLSGYYLGRSSAGILALFCALTVTVVVTLDSTGLAAYDSPVVVALALTTWAAVLGLTAILVGTLCDQRAETVGELEVAYVGVIEVLSRYLQSANPKFKAKSVRVAERAQHVAERLGLSRKQVDDVRVGALLYDLGKVEITTKLISKAVNSLESAPVAGKHTFMGTDLVQSLGSVLHSALPLLVNQEEAARELLSLEDDLSPIKIPIGAKIIPAVRSFDELTEGRSDNDRLSPAAAIRELRADSLAAYDPEVLDAIEHVCGRPLLTVAAEPAFCP